MCTPNDLSVPVSVALEVTPESVAHARDIIRRALGEHPQVEDAALATSELMTNVVRHAPTSEQATLVIERSSPDTIRVSIRQNGAGIERLEPTGGDGGRGLRIVAAITDRWGVERKEWTGVWFEIAC